LSLIQEAVEHLRAAVAKIDERLLANEHERVQLVESKRQLLDLIGEPAAPASPVPAKPATTGRAPASSSSRTAPARETGIKTVDAANRVVAFLEKHSPAKPSEVYAAAKLPETYASRKLLNDLVEVKRIVRTGTGRGTSLSLPGRQTARAAADDTEGD